MNPPVVLSSTYVSHGVPQPGEPLYTRMDTETWHPFEETIAALERASEPGVVFASGMAAIASVFSFVPVGGVVVVPRHAYQVTLGFADDLAARADVTVRRVDVADTDQVVAALDGADLAILESPTNPMLEVADLPALLDAARQRGVLTAVDNTFATPLGQQPLTLGADLVVHSVTKYLAGHSDVVLGAVVTDEPELARRVRGYRTLHGAIPGPWEVWLALRGVRTLALRVERSQATALELARRLEKHPAVLEVRHPGSSRTPAMPAPRGTCTGSGRSSACDPGAAGRSPTLSSTPYASGSPRRASAGSSHAWSADVGSPRSRRPCPTT